MLTYCEQQGYEIVSEYVDLGIAGDQSGGGSGVKDPGAHDKKPQGGGKKIAGATMSVAFE